MAGPVPVIHETRPRCDVGPYDMIVGALPTGPYSPTVVAVPELTDALAALNAAFDLEVVHIEATNDSERNPL